MNKRRFHAFCAMLGAAVLLAPGTAASASGSASPQPFQALSGIDPTGYLYTAAVLGPKSVIAGGSGIGDPSHARLQRWTGSTVSTMPSGNVIDEAFSTYITDFAVLSSTDVWAIGGYCDYHFCSGLQAHWNGRAWKTVPAPKVVSAHAWDSYTTDAITAVGKTVWISGSSTAINPSGETDSSDAMILRRDAAGHWTRTMLPLVPGGVFSDVTGIYAVSATNIWAAGYYHTNSTLGTTRQIIWHFDGASWRIVPVPAPSGTSGVTSMQGRPGDIWLTLCGSAQYGCDTPSNTLLHYAAGVWTPVTTPPGWRITAVRSAGAKDVWAVGSVNNSALAAHWRGHSWQRFPVRLPSTSIAELNSIVLTAHQVIAVGDQQTHGANYPHTLWVARPR